MSERYHFEGVLITTTGLHIGSGQGDFVTDARVVRTGQGQPYIPGSSLKGALRSAVERMVGSLQGVGQQPLRTCLLDGTNGVGDPTCPTVHQGWQEAFSQQRTALSEEQIGEWLYTGTPAFPDVTLCDTCRLFGSPFVASKVSVPDSPLQQSKALVTEIRHGVGIDRDTGAARPQIKFDYEALPVATTFRFALTVETAPGDALSVRDLGLLCAGIRALAHGQITLGGNASRGLGGCRLQLEQIEQRSLTSAAAWLDWLIARDKPEASGRTLHRGEAAGLWMDSAIRRLFQELGVA